MPTALIALAVFVAVIVVWNVVVKRNMGEAMILGFIATLFFAGAAAPSVAVDSMVEATESEVLYAAAAFVFMTYFVERVGVIGKLVQILSAALGRLRGGPALVDTVTSGVMGALAGGSNTGNAAASGSITGPWMISTGWKRSRAATVIAGNAGLGAALPPSASMIIMIGFAGTMVTTSQVYIALLVAGLYQVLWRIVLTLWFVRRDGVPAETGHHAGAVKQALRAGWPSTLIFFGALIPIFVTVGPLADALTATGRYGESLDEISLIVWIPILIIAISAVIAWRELPRTVSGWWEFFRDSVPHFFTIGVLLYFAIAASQVLDRLGLAADVDQVIGGLSIPTWMLVAIVGFMVVVVAGPLSSTATLSAVGQVSLVTLVGAGIDPLLAVVALLVFASTEGSSPPASGSIFVACGITEAKPESTFIPLIIYYVLPITLLGVLIALGIVPVPIN
ncbi:TRAP transporter large permease subunit [Zhihengliuella halotolerans]|uniref:TRAP-type C4-dicarboxylate transport system permease large subunit n=1 Tax=Zhihengliuella halotolerans TaxID=370736 RepID=A0A4Q8AH84_9MICC|nr:TRAP transporter large permease subunit [Zhihengliuella halotolerans]RZU63674.1 TRAP-type C4-dicarboxylate transport system permease large subunit [Zhihengliuella halotolerans]